MAVIPYKQERFYLKFSILNKFEINTIDSITISIMAIALAPSSALMQNKQFLTVKHILKKYLG